MAHHTIGRKAPLLPSLRTHFRLLTILSVAQSYRPAKLVSLIDGGPKLVCSDACKLVSTYALMCAQSERSERGAHLGGLVIVSLGGWEWRGWEAYKGGF